MRILFLGLGLLCGSVALAAPPVDTLPGVTLGGKPVQGPTYRGADIPTYHAVEQVLRSLAEDRDAASQWYEVTLEELHIEVGSAAEAALAGVLENPFFDLHPEQKAWDLSQPGRRQAMQTAAVRDADALGRLWGELLGALEETGYDVAHFWAHVEERRAGMAVTFLHDDDPGPEIVEQENAFQQARQEVRP